MKSDGSLPCVFGAIPAREYLRLYLFFAATEAIGQRCAAFSHCDDSCFVAFCQAHGVFTADSLCGLSGKEKRDPGSLQFSTRRRIALPLSLHRKVMARSARE
jgi:hypothetical protein